MPAGDDAAAARTAQLRALPSVDQLAAHSLLTDLPRQIAVQAAREAVSEARVRFLNGPLPSETPVLEDLALRAATLAHLASRFTLRRAINATGVLLHTNLGRATLAPAAIRAVADVARGHSTLETDEETGGRGSRQDHVTRLLCDLTGAEDALVVNNNAAATFLVVTSVAGGGRGVVLSRGQMVEIGGHFRLPDVIESAGARLIEVGTTNRTRIGDYQKALERGDAALLLRVHTSNYRIVGFTEEASLAELVALGRSANVPVGDDIGSGALVDFAPWGLGGEPTAQASVEAGADIVWFSGDKLLGGPQAGILIGSARHIAPMKRHPLARALRPDKLTLAALRATLRLYQTGEAWREIPILRRIARPEGDVRAACVRVTEAAGDMSASGVALDIVPTHAEVGGGSLPGSVLSSWAIAAETDDVASLARRLRARDIPVYGRVEKKRLLLDLRAVDGNEEAEVMAALCEQK